MLAGLAHWLWLSGSLALLWLWRWLSGSLALLWLWRSCRLGSLPRLPLKISPMATMQVADIAWASSQAPSPLFRKRARPRALRMLRSHSRASKPWIDFSFETKCNRTVSYYKVNSQLESQNPLILGNMYESMGAWVTLSHNALAGLHRMHAYRYVIGNGNGIVYNTW